MTNKNIEVVAKTTTTPAIDVAALQAEMEALRHENAKLTANLNTIVKKGIKVSEKGGVSVYGLGRFPVTLYKEQWLKLLAMAQDIQDFIRDNASKLKEKPAKV